MEAIEHHDELNETGARKRLAIFLLVHAAVWVTVSLFRVTPHFDSVEALTWGLTGQWGTTKHPPLSGWLADLALRLVGDPDLALYLLSQACVVVGMIFVYKLALTYLTPANALFSAVLLEGCVYYGFESVAYNVNVLSLALLPGVAYMLRRAMLGGGWGYWPGAGLLAGLSLLTKYTNGIALFALALYFILTAAGRGRLKSPGPYLAVLVALLVILPHVLWLAKYDFAPLAYSRGRSAAYQATVAATIFNPLKIFFMQFAGAGAALAIFGYMYAKTPRDRRGPVRPSDPFLFFAGLLPLVVLTLIVAVGQMKGTTKWAYAFVGLFPLLLFANLPFSPPPAVRRRGLALAYGTMLLFAAGYLAMLMTRTSDSNHFDGRRLAAIMDGEWRRETARPLRLVGGELKLTFYVSTYAPDRPETYYFGETAWKSDEDVERDGLLVVTDDPKEYRRYRQHYREDLPEAKTVGIVMKSRFGDEKTVTVYYGMVPPRTAEATDA